MATIGCDWSPAQGPNIDMVGAAKEGVSFVWLKTAHGKDGDGEWLAAVLDHAIDTYELLGGYIWFKPRQDPKLQAANVAKRTEKLIARASCPLPIMFDFEDNDRNNVLGPIHGQQFIDVTSICLEEITRLTGCRPLFYTGKWFMDEAIGSLPCPAITSLDLCHAEYPNTTRSGGEHMAEYMAAIAALPKAHLPKQWNQWRFRQFDGDKGLYLPQGLDSDFDEFDGTLLELRAWAKAQWSWTSTTTDGALQLNDGSAAHDPYMVDRAEAARDTTPAPPDVVSHEPDTIPNTPTSIKKVSSMKMDAVRAPSTPRIDTWDGNEPPKS